MKVYFLSSEPCALTLNDVYFGITDTFERFIEIDPKDCIYARFSPQDKLPIGFFINEELRFSPPDGCDIYLLKDGLAIYAWDFVFRDPTMRIITQKRQGNTLFTVFCQGRVQLSIQTNENFFVAYLPPSFLKCDLSFHDELCLLEGETMLAVYDKQGNCLLLEQFLSYTIENDLLNATLPLSDSQKRVADCSWQLQGSTCTRVRFSIRFSSEKSLPPCPPLAYAFFESLLIGADPTPFLSDSLTPQLDEIKAFLGRYEQVILSPMENVCSLVKKKGERLFALHEYSVETENGKIVDVKG